MYMFMQCIGMILCLYPICVFSIVKHRLFFLRMVRRDTKLRYYKQGKKRKLCKWMFLMFKLLKDEPIKLFAYLQRESIMCSYWLDGFPNCYPNLRYKQWSMIKSAIIITFELFLDWNSSVSETFADLNQSISTTPLELLIIYREIVEFIHFLTIF